MNGVMKADGIRNKYVSSYIDVASMVLKIKGNIMRWFGLVIKKDKSEAVTTNEEKENKN